MISPHLDDGVFSCGELIAHMPGTVVATVLAGIPDPSPRVTGWDAAAGFDSAARAVACRRGEDRAALALLRARPRWLDFFDGQYAGSPRWEALVDGLDALLGAEDPHAVLFPAGLRHPDHVLVHRAMLAVRRRRPHGIWLMYEDALYRCLPGLMQLRLLALARQGLVATPVPAAPAGRLGRKRAAVECYRSQLRVLVSHARGYADALAPERYWRIDAAAENRFP
ncbi:PIG-L deacetylase family protein [Massilia glaciei]|uniref:PIG-L deacetylase family protein n=1 Tax=Massilia glaciei TaxID=1524097 RepID=UPI0015E80C70|nr:PIG-L family deacetylase [Massilia glaciei]